MEKTFHNDIFKGQIQWLSELIKPNGEFVTYSKPSKNSYRMVPYFSNIAAVGLLEDPSKAALVKKYLIWYTSHLNFPDRFGSKGSIYDYFLRTNGELISTDDYDSNDSYPATFIILCRKYFNITKDLTFFQPNRSFIDSIVESMISTMDNDNLTWAKPNYKIKYLMDNCEVYDGLLNASKFYKEVYDDDNASKRLYDLSQASLNAIEKLMWDNRGFYYPLIDNGGNKSKPDYDKWYPDATSQLFPILCRVINPDSLKAKEIYNKFNSHHPDWHKFKKDNHFPDTYVGYVALKMKDYERVSSFIDFCINKYAKNQNAWPWYSVESSYLILTISEFEKIRQS